MTVGRFSVYKCHFREDSAFAETLDSRGLEWFGKLLGGLPEGLVGEYLGLRKAVRETGSMEATILRASDKIEALLWAYEEYLLGNVQVRRALIVEDILSKLDQIELSTVKVLATEIRKRLEIQTNL